MTAQPVAIGDASLWARRGRLIGREHQLEAALGRLLEPTVRLLTLIGPGGSGKTRLAVELAHRAAPHFRGGTWLVDLSALTDWRLVLPMLAQALGVPDRGEGTLAERVARRLGATPALALLDNLEHVAAAAPALGELLAACPSLTLLATSRAPLRLTWEHTFPVPPLPLAVAADDVVVPAVALFVERARAARPDFALNADNRAAVEALCARLDGLPLAIELVAARCHLLSPAAILERLEQAGEPAERRWLLGARAGDLPLRHHTLQEAVRWSYNLLPPADQRLLRRCAVFAGGFTSEALGALLFHLDDADDQRPLLQRLEVLVDSSLLLPGTPGGLPGERFGMLRTIREVVLEWLEESGEAEQVRGSHARVLLDLAERGEPELWGAGQGAWAARLRAEQENLRTALRWCLERAGRPGGDAPAAEIGLRLAAAVWQSWFAQGLLAEGRAWLTRFLGLPAGSIPAAARARALAGAGYLAFAQGDYRQAADLFRRSLAVGEGAGREVELALLGLGIVARLMGDEDAARGLLERGAADSREAGRASLLAFALGQLGAVAFAEGREDEARARYEEFLTLARHQGHRWGEALARAYLGELEARRGEHVTARAHFQAALAAWRAIDDHRGVAIALVGLADLARLEGDHTLAGAHLREALALARDQGDRQGLARALEGRARLQAAQGQARPALRLAGAAAQLRQAQGLRPAPAERAFHERSLEPARRSLGATAARRAWAEGRALDLPEALAEAAADPPRAAAPRPATAGPLTRREREVATLVAQGCSNRQLAERLVISERTAEIHVSNILGKLGLTSRTQLATWALHQSLESTG